MRVGIFQSWDLIAVELTLERYERAVKGASDDGSLEKETPPNLTLVWFNIREEREELGEAFGVLLTFLTKDADLVGNSQFLSYTFLKISSVFPYLFCSF